MATSLLVLLDDIASVLDDVAVLTKVATRKTAGVLGDDLALNAQQVTGVRADRELPVVWAVAKGSFVNKAILIPAALLISAIAPWLVTPLLMAGGAFLCYEGFEKLVHKLGTKGKAEAAEHRVELRRAAGVSPDDLLKLERDKIKGAIRTDFILSAEIIVIALGTVATQPILTRVLVLVGIGLVMTVGVYGLVAAIVKLDDAGVHLAGRPGAAARAIGNAILWVAPRLMKALSVAGTAAMFLVGGGILVHGVPQLHHFADAFAARVAALPGADAVGAWLGPTLYNAAVGIIAGAILVAVVAIVRRVLPERASAPATGSH
jgi:hypothetical protein